ncbi:peptidoglycan editing factor PgeF [Paenibacillus sp. M1]|uniref:Purine nucleoside phosphorylase n=1 Tax=Paenibacillus haidiansis TaxID=1574488 RepID=A0ABU7VLL5_9BACL
MEPFIRNPIQQLPERYEIAAWNNLVPEISAGFTGRAGGVGEGPYDSLNLALHVGDDPEAVLENRRRLASALGFAPEAWTCGEQIHGTAVAAVAAADRGKGLADRAGAFQDTDALVTNVPGVLLASFYADCVPLYFLDPVNRAVGLAHAGWKGTVGRISEAVIDRMEREYGSRRSDIRAAIGPSIGACCYEVDERVMVKVREAFAGILSGEWEPSVAAPSPHEGRTMLNLKEMNRIIMIKAGILPTHIECTSWCTSCHSDRFFSYRKHSGVTGRMASWVGLKGR